MLVKPGRPPEGREQPLEERELTELDVEVIELALRTKRPVGWVHAMAMARKIVELEEEIRLLRRGREDHQPQPERGRHERMAGEPREDQDRR
jgi:hypothetical protein